VRILDFRRGDPLENLAYHRLVGRRGLFGRGLVVVGLALLVPANAFGSTVSRVVENGIGSLEYYAAQGEANDLEIVSADDRTMTIMDAGESIFAGDGCVQVDAHQVTCSPVDSATFFLADLEDTAAVAGGTVRLTIIGGSEDDDLTVCAACRGTLIGGSGDDTLRGGGLGSSLSGETGSDTIVGGGGRDEINAGAGADTISGRRGRDLIRPSSGNDTVDGGSGRDRFFLDSAPGPVSVDLRTETVTGWGTKAVTQIENVTGSVYADTLCGDQFANVFSGLRGDDVIVGRGSDDVIDGGSGRDRMFGRRGADALLARDGRHDLVAGGIGRDQARIDARDDVRSIEAFL
jgi:Ca2+-binding RTX toxin-like protein